MLGRQFTPRQGGEGGPELHWRLTGHRLTLWAMRGAPIRPCPTKGNFWNGATLGKSRLLVDGSY